MPLGYVTDSLVLSTLLEIDGALQRIANSLDDIAGAIAPRKDTAASKEEQDEGKTREIPETGKEV